VGDNGAAWARREGEGDRPWAMFCAYRDLPPERRSLPVVRESAAGAPSVSLLKRWSARHDWRARASEYDRHVDLVKLAAVDDAVADGAARTETLREALHAKLSGMIDAAETPDDLLKLARTWGVAAVTEAPALTFTAPGWGARHPAAPVLTHEQEERRFRSALVILAEAGVVILPEHSGEPGLTIDEED
jgi:hypothetical protein